jgi:hypothetical protein
MNANKSKKQSGLKKTKKQKNKKGTMQTKKSNQKVVSNQSLTSDPEHAQAEGDGQSSAHRVISRASKISVSQRASRTSKTAVSQRADAVVSRTSRISISRRVSRTSRTSIGKRGSRTSRTSLGAVLNSDGHTAPEKHADPGNNREIPFSQVSTGVRTTEIRKTLAAILQARPAQIFSHIYSRSVINFLLEQRSRREEEEASKRRHSQPWQRRRSSEKGSVEHADSPSRRGSVNRAADSRGASGISPRQASTERERRVKLLAELSSHKSRSLSTIGHFHSVTSSWSTYRRQGTFLSLSSSFLKTGFFVVVFFLHQ